MKIWSTYDASTEDGAANLYWATEREATRHANAVVRDHWEDGVRNHKEMDYDGKPPTLAYCRGIYRVTVDSFDVQPTKAGILDALNRAGTMM